MKPATPLYFGPGERPLFGWLHTPPDGATSNVGVVICSPFGYEAVCAHRTLRHLASSTAAAGMPTLRFDYDGTGNSAGDDFDPQRVAAWQASVQHACNELKTRCGIDSICLIGVRLGAALAITVARSRTDVAGLVAIAPVLSPKSYLRELRVFDAAIRAPGAQADGMLESAGYVMTAETVDALSRLDVKAQISVPRMLILDREDFPVAQAWATSQEAACDVTYATTSEYSRMSMSPIERQLPTGLLEHIGSWLQGWRMLHTIASAAVDVAPATVQLQVAANREAVVETAQFMDESAPMFAILAQGAGARRTRRGILLLNAGATHNIGFSRLYVALARRWASEGDAVLRLDLRGIGESPPPAGCIENEVYPASAAADVAQACQFLRDRHGVTEIVGIGLCAGAYHALKAAGNGVALDAIVMINPLTFFWTPGSVLTEEFAAERVVRDAERYKKNVWRAESWKKVLSGKVDLVSVGLVAMHRFNDKARALGREMARILGLPLQDDLAAELAGIAKRGIGMHFIFAASDPGLALLRDQGGAAVRRMERNGIVSRTMIPDANHTFTSLAARTALINELQSLLDRHLAAPRRTTG